MLTSKTLNNIAALERDYRKALLEQHIYDEEYDKEFKCVLENLKRSKIKQILSADEFKPLAAAHNGEYSVYVASTDRWERKSFDLHGAAILDDRNHALKSVLRDPAYVYVSEGLIDDFCRLAEEAMFNPSNAKLESMKTQKLKIQNHVSRAKSVWQTAIINALDVIKSTHDESVQVNQLLIYDKSENDTIGHFCLREDNLTNKAIYLEYAKIMLALSSEHIYRILLTRNGNEISILSLYLNSNLNFLFLADKLLPENLAKMFSNTYFFEEIMTNKQYSGNFFKLLKRKFGDSALGLAQLSALLDLDNESMESTYNGWSVTCDLLKLNRDNQDSDPILDYIDLLTFLPVEKVQRRFNQANLDGDTFIALFLSRINGMGYEPNVTTPKKTMNIKILIELLGHFKFPPEIIEKLANVPGLKHEVGHYLLTLPFDSTNLALLKRAIDQRCSLGQFFWELQRMNNSIHRLFSSPATVATIRHRIAAMEQNLTVTSSNAADASSEKAASAPSEDDALPVAQCVPVYTTPLAPVMYVTEYESEKGPC